MQKLNTILLFALVIAVSCHKNDPYIVPSGSLVKKETQFTADTNEKLSETVYSYNSAGDLTSEKYTALIPDNGTIEKTFQYNSEHKLTKLVETHTPAHDPSTAPWNYTTIYDYQNDLLQTETEFYLTTVPLSKTSYFYNGKILADSSQLFYITNSAFTYNGANYYQYDSQGRLIQQSRSFFDGTVSVILTSTYNGDHLIQTCDPFTERGGTYPCVRNEFNSLGQLYRMYSTTTGSEGKLLEEYKYDSKGLLSQTTKFDQLIPQATYTSPTIHTVLVKYEY